MKKSKDSKYNKLGNTSKSKTTKTSNKHRMYVIVYNINYHNNDGNIILNDKINKNKILKDYKYDQGSAGPYGFYHEYIIPSKKIEDFKSDITSYYKNLGIKNLKIIVNDNKKTINSKLHLLDKKSS